MQEKINKQRDEVLILTKSPTSFYVKSEPISVLEGDINIGQIHRSSRHKEAKAKKIYIVCLSFN